MIDIEKLNEALKVFVKKALNAWKLIKELLQRYKDLLSKIGDAYFKHKKQIEHMRSSWNVPFDTRKASQVMMNKPKFTIRKVIR